MKCIYDRRGVIVGWLGSDETVYDTRGKPCAFVKEQRVYSFGQNLRGVFMSGYFRDGDGGAIAFVEGARGEPSLPNTRCNRIPPKTLVLPRPSVPVSPGPLPKPRDAWSGETFHSFIGVSDPPPEE